MWKRLAETLWRSSVLAMQGQLKNPWASEFVQFDNPTTIVGVIMYNPKMLKQHVEETFYDIEKVWVTPSFNIMYFNDDNSETLKCFG